MTSHPQKPVATRMPAANVSTLPNATPIEEDFENLQFRGTHTDKGPNSEAPASNQRQLEDKNKAAIEGCIRTGELMKVLFPDGVKLKSEEEFAAFRLFDRLVGEIAHFAKTGMKGPAPLRGITMHATLLERMVSNS
jgi:hypothetical protein